ncbi:hypothetical protein [Methanofollis ethanolicus]|uniref:hypothetical protein n=1 Tax=Methanofollis ethanolicus TaxID=488124 RepID=UPI00128EFB2D|nr:hypothetical protein [Methanofollis ethanolicus]
MTLTDASYMIDASFSNRRQKGSESMDIKERMVPEREGYCCGNVDACPDLVISIGVYSSEIFEFCCVRKTRNCVKRGECPIRNPEENMPDYD